MSTATFEGKWAWEGEDPSQRHIVFANEGGSIKLILVTNGSVAGCFDNLSINRTSSSSGCMHFCNNWLSNDGTSLFRFESQYSDEENDSIFVNVSEFSFASPDRMLQRLMGYRFDRETEKWAPFETAHALIRVE